MFGSGDDKKTPQPAPRADTPETVEQAVSASAAKPVKKGLFSWFSKKTAEPQTPASRAAEPSVATADSSQHVQTAEPVSTSVQPQAEPAAIEQAAAAGQPTNEALVLPRASLYFLTCIFLRDKHDTRRANIDSRRGKRRCARC